MVVWKDTLYVAGISPRRQKRIKRAIQRRRPVRNVFLFTAPSNAANTLEFFSANELLQPIYQKKTVTVYGMAGGKDAAEELAASMICGTYASTGGFSVIPFLESRECKKEGDTA